MLSNAIIIKSSQTDRPFVCVCMRRANDEKMGLKRKELFWCNKLAAERAADAVQRACDAAAAAEVAFVPSHKFPAARSLALRTWAREPCKIDAYEYADEKYGVKDLERHEPDALMTIEVFKLSVADKAAKGFKAQLSRSPSSPTTLASPFAVKGEAPVVMNIPDE